MHYLTEFDKKYKGEKVSNDMKEDFIKVRDDLKNIFAYGGPRLPFAVSCTPDLLVDTAGFLLNTAVPGSRIALSTSISTIDSKDKGYLCLTVKHFQEKIKLSQLEVIAKEHDLTSQGTRQVENEHR